VFFFAGAVLASAFADLRTPGWISERVAVYMIANNAAAAASQPGCCYFCGTLSLT
jgi:hypothetical protein